MRGAGFQVEARDVGDSDLKAKLQQSGVPDLLDSCHAAHVGGYIVVGHVPARSIRRLLREKPTDVIGIGVAGMPLGSPGMEQGGGIEHYEVMAFRRNGHTFVYERY